MPYRHLGPAAAPVIYRPHARGDRFLVLSSFCGAAMVWPAIIVASSLERPDPLSSIFRLVFGLWFLSGPFVVGVALLASLAWIETRVIVQVTADAARVVIHVRQWPWSGTEMRHDRETIADVGIRRHRHRNREVAELGLCAVDGSFIPLLPVEYGSAKPAVAEEGLARMRALLDRTGHR